MIELPKGWAITPNIDVFEMAREMESNKRLPAVPTDHSSKILDNLIDLFTTKEGIATLTAFGLMLNQLRK